MPSEIFHNVLAKRRQATFVSTIARKLGNYESSPRRHLLCETIHKRSELVHNLLYAIRITVWQIVAPNWGKLGLSEIFPNNLKMDVDIVLDCAILLMSTNRNDTQTENEKCFLLFSKLVPKQLILRLKDSQFSLVVN